MAEHPSLRPLCLVMKAALQQRGLDDPSLGGLGSYSLINLLAYSLRRAPANGSENGLNAEDPSGLLASALLDFLQLFGCVPPPLWHPPLPLMTRWLRRC
eukprot:416383-Prorocentrum_minimum.AAC.1